MARLEDRMASKAGMEAYWSTTPSLVSYQAERFIPLDVVVVNL